MITANIARSSTIRLNCGLVVLPLPTPSPPPPRLFRLILTNIPVFRRATISCTSSKDIRFLRRCSDFSLLRRVKLNKIRRTLLAGSFQIRLDPASNAMCLLHKRPGFRQIGRYKNANTIESEIVLTSVGQSSAAAARSVLTHEGQFCVALVYFYFAPSAKIVFVPRFR